MKKKVFVFVLMLAVLTVSSIYAAQFGTVLNFIQRNVEKGSQGTRVLSDFFRYGGDIMAVRSGRQGYEVPVLIYIKSSRSFPRFSFNFHRINSRVLSAYVTLPQLMDLKGRGDVLYVQGRLKKQLYNDVAVAAINADVVWNAPTSPSNPGVLVGIVDSGIDHTHQAFRRPTCNPDYESRIHYLWDQTDASNSGVLLDGATYNLGREWDRIQIGTHACTSVEPQENGGHGTHVAGSFTGYDFFSNNVEYRGSATSNGVNSNAILFVKTDFQHVLEGVKYLYQKAQSMGKPIVVNLSLGSQYGPHDGTDVETAALDDLIAGSNGDLIVVRAAGNDADANVHASAVVTTAVTQVDLNVEPYVTSGYDLAILSFYYEPTADINVRVRDSNGAVSSWIAPSHDNPYFGDSGTEFVLPDGTGCMIANNNVTEGYNSTIRRIDIWLGDFNLPSQYLRSGTGWKVEFQTGSGSAEIHGWRAVDFTDGAVSFSQGSAYSIGNGAAGHNVITVGAYTSRKSWNSQSGTYSFTGSSNLNDIANFSSRGPARDGGQKPDVTAGGTAIFSAFASNILGLTGASFPAGGDDTYQVMQGTSMSSPIVAGGVVLLKEQHPTWDYQDVLNYIQLHSQGNAYCTSPGTWSAAWGWGILDLTDALD